MTENPAYKPRKPLASPCRKAEGQRVLSLTFGFTARVIGAKNERYSQGCPEGGQIGRELVEATNVKTSEVDVAMTCRYEGR